LLVASPEATDDLHARLIGARCHRVAALAQGGAAPYLWKVE